MKKNDLALFFFPASIVIITVLSAIMLVHQFSKFEKAYLREATANIIQNTDFATQIILPYIESENMEKAKAFCLQFSDRPSTLRLTLIDSQGNVLSDTEENSEIFDNHLLRPEVQKALAGTPEVQIRYSSTLNQQMIYYAKPITSASGQTYILRVAETSKHVQEILSLAKLNLFFALLLGAAFITLLILYIVHRVRRPLVKLQESAVRITQGYLDEKIFIPNSGIIRDLAINLREMEEKLREQLEYVTHENTERELIYQTMGEAILIINRDGEVLSHNHAADHLFGIQQSTPSFNINRAGSTELILLIQNAFEEHEKIEKELILSRDGHELILYVRGSLIIRQDTPCLLMVIMDLTNLHKLESFRIDFITNVSHEIKTPLTSILSAVESLEDGGIHNPEYAEKFLSILSQQSKRLNFLVQDILSLATLEQRQSSENKNFTLFRLDSTVENAVNACLAQANENKIELQITENMPLEIQGDCGYLEEALVNLITNAIRYSKSPKIEISLTQEDKEAIIAVRDFGIGISSEHTPRIFERFYRVHKERSRQFGGTGLGLAIVKHIAKLHKGAATLETAPGKGCTFKITLPLHQ